MDRFVDHRCPRCEQVVTTSPKAIVFHECKRKNNKIEMFKIVEDVAS